MKKIVFLIGMMIGFIIQCFSEPAPGSLPMISSVDNLRLYALGQSERVEAGFWQQTPGVSNFKTAPVTEKSVAGIIKTVSSMDFNLDVVDFTSPISMDVSVRNADGDTLFTGFKRFSLVRGTGKYATELPPGYGNIDLNMTSVPIDIEGVTEAYIVFSDDGQVTFSHELFVRDGKVFFPPEFAGTKNNLAVHVNGKGFDNWYYWQIASGMGLDTVGKTMEVGKVTIEGFKTFLGNGVNQNVDIVISTEQGKGVNQICELNVLGGDAIYTFSFQTTEGKWPIGYWVKRPDGSMTPYEGETMPDGDGVIRWINLRLQKGTYYVIPVWNLQDLQDPNQYNSKYPPSIGLG